MSIRSDIVDALDTIEDEIADVEEINIPVRNMGFGANSEKRTNRETIYIFKKDSHKDGWTKKNLKMEE